ncbi:unnamed protein product [Clonostachys solani]|uniref:Uncharacterized protein n=1 Tax=Clonostachys solani TaxID=160281 RepID=A0A9N9ZD80_9HYPO|nr:unnamed protein product [Clonostachys solani]
MGYITVANITRTQLEKSSFAIAGAISDLTHRPSDLPLNLDVFAHFFAVNDGRTSIGDVYYANFLASRNISSTPEAAPTEGTTVINIPNPGTTTTHPLVDGTENLLQIAAAENTVDVEESADILAERISAPSCAEATHADLENVLNYTGSLESNDSAVEDGLDGTDEGETGADDLEWGRYIHLHEVFASANPKSDIYHRLCLLEVETFEMAKEIGDNQRTQHHIEDGQITMLVFEISQRHRDCTDKVVDFFLC